MNIYVARLLVLLNKLLAIKADRANRALLHDCEICILFQEHADRIQS